MRYAEGCTNTPVGAIITSQRKWKQHQTYFGIFTLTLIAYQVALVEDRSFSNREDPSTDPALVDVKMITISFVDMSDVP